MIKIDWDNFEVIEAEDYTKDELSATIEDVREFLDSYGEAGRDSMLAEELLETLTDMESRHE